MKPNNGFTLLEMMMTLAIVGILLTVGVPSFKTLITNNRITSQTNDFITDLSIARSEAVKRNVWMTVCTSNTKTGCTVSGWNQGWIVFTDVGKDGAVSTGDTILRVNTGFTGNTTLAISGFNNANYIQFLPNGTVTGVTQGDPTHPAKFTLCYSGYTGKDIIFTTTGRMSSSATTSTCP